MAAREERQHERPAYEWRRAGDAAIIRVRRFKGPPEEHARLRQLETDYPAHRSARLIVFDLRGNEGGADHYAFAWVKEAKRGPWEAKVWAVYPLGSHMPWLRWNQEVWETLHQGRVDDPDAVAAREKLRAGWPKRSAELSLRFQVHQIETHAKAPYRGPVVILVDRGTGSAGESAAMIVRDALGASIVGERTAGYKEYGNQRVLVLPRTGLVFHFATKRNYFTTPVEALGLPPDVYLPPELMAAPVEELLPLLRKLPRPKR